MCSLIIPLMLNNQQKTCLQNVLNFLESDRKFYLVNGEAGSGKTYLIKQIIKNLPKEKSVIVTAPTNKACQVLENTLDGVTIQTIHKTLGLTMQQVEEKQILVRNPLGFSQLEEYDFCVIDEGSMISKDLMDIIVGKVNSILGENTKILVLADEAQIQPVGEMRSPVFSIPNRSDLTEIVRQKQDSPLMPIIQATRGLALGSRRIKFNEFLINNFQNNEGVLVYPYEKWMEQIVRSFSSENYQSDPTNHSKIIAWRNVVSDKLALKVRSLVNKSTQVYEAGDLIYTKDAVKHPYDPDVIAIQNCTEMEIIKSKPLDYEINNQTIKAWKLEVCNVEDQTVNSINVVDPEYLAIFHRMMGELIQEAKTWQRENRNGDSSKMWREFYRHKFNFAEVSHIHSITVRRSQGSEWENCFVWLPDLLAAKDWSHVYTAFSRTRKRLIIGV